MYSICIFCLLLYNLLLVVSVSMCSWNPKDRRRELLSCFFRIEGVVSKGGFSVLERCNRKQQYEQCSIHHLQQWNTFKILMRNLKAILNLLKKKTKKQELISPGKISEKLQKVFWQNNCLNNQKCRLQQNYDISD